MGYLWDTCPRRLCAPAGKGQYLAATRAEPAARAAKHRRGGLRLASHPLAPLALAPAWRTSRALSSGLEEGSVERTASRRVHRTALLVFGERVALSTRDDNAARCPPTRHRAAKEDSSYRPLAVPLSNSPFLTPSRKHSHSYWSYSSTRPARSPATRISTQSPAAPAGSWTNAISIAPSPFPERRQVWAPISMPSSATVGLPVTLSSLPQSGGARSPALSPGRLFA